MTFLGIAVGVCFVLAGQTQLVEEWSYYVLVLRWLSHIGAGICLLVALRIFRHYTFAGPYIYIREGMPAAGRVLGVGSIGSHCESELHQFCLAIGVEFLHPETKQLTYTTLLSDRIAATQRIPNYSVPLHPGEYVTLVALPRNFDSTLRAYGFLGLNPNESYVHKNGHPTLSSPASTSLAMIAIYLALLIVVIPTFVFLMEAFPSLDGPVTPAIIGATVGALALGVIGLIIGLRRPIENRARQSALLGGCCGLMFGAIGGFLVTNVLNAMLDQSEASYREVEVIEFWEETVVSMILRRYEIEVRVFPGGIIAKVPSKPQSMDFISVTYAGVADVRKGAFGMSWIRTLHPAVLVSMEPGDPDELRVHTVLAENLEAQDDLHLKAIIPLPTEEILTPSNAMLRRIRLRLSTVDD